MGDSGSTHADSSRDIKYAFLTVTQQPEDLKTCTVTNAVEGTGHTAQVSLEGIAQERYGYPHDYVGELELSYKLPCLSVICWCKQTQV